MRLDYGAATDVGLLRNENQDRYLADGTLFAVADGLGGHAGGSVAARIATDVLSRRGRLESLAQLIVLVGAANTAILEEARDDPRLRGMSTTLCVLACVGDACGPSRLAVANVGDSRLYMLTPDGLSQLSVDHTISENLVRDGVLTAGEADTHADRHKLTRAVGFEPRVHVDGWKVAAVSGTRFLICSDGLTNEVSDPRIAEILRSGAGAAAAAARLVERALQPGRGRDNVTAVVVDVLDAAGLELHGSNQMVLESRPAVEA